MKKYMLLVAFVLLLILMILIIIPNKYAGGKESSDYNSLNTNEENVIREMLYSYRNDDGGYHYYEDSEYTIYYTYYSLFILEMQNKLTDSEKEKTREWLKKIDPKFITDSNSYSYLSNIYYFIQASKIVNYEISEETRKQMESCLSSLENEYGYYMSSAEKKAEFDKFDPARILSNSLAVKISGDIGGDIDKNKMVSWAKGLLRKEEGDEVRKIREIAVALEILYNFDSISGDDLEYTKEIFNNTTIPSTIDTIDVYYICLTNKYLNELGQSSYNKMDYHKYLVDFFKSSTNGDIVFWGLALKIAKDVGFSAELDSKISEIRKGFLSNGSYSDQFKGKSDITETFYSYKLLSLIGSRKVDISNLKRFVKTFDEIYEKMSDYEKLLFLELKHEAGLNTITDLNRLDKLFLVAENHDVFTNHFIVDKLLEVSLKYNYKISSSLSDKVNDSVKENMEIIEDDNCDISIVKKIYLYGIASKIKDYSNAQILQERIIDEFSANEYKFIEFKQILFLLNQSKVKIEFKDYSRVLEMNIQLKDSLNYCIENRRLEFGEGSDKGIIPLYLIMEILYN